MVSHAAVRPPITRPSDVLKAMTWLQRPLGRLRRQGLTDGTFGTLPRIVRGLCRSMKGRSTAGRETAERNLRSAARSASSAVHLVFLPQARSIVEPPPSSGLCSSPQFTLTDETTVNRRDAETAKKHQHSLRARRFTVSVASFFRAVVRLSPISGQTRRIDAYSVAFVASCLPGGSFRVSWIRGNLLCAAGSKPRR
jgi:hypothetical protein